VEAWKPPETRAGRASSTGWRARMSKPPGQRRPRLTCFRFPTPGSVAGTSPKWGVPPA